MSRVNTAYITDYIYCAVLVRVQEPCIRCINQRRIERNYLLSQGLLLVCHKEYNYTEYIEYIGVDMGG